MKRTVLLILHVVGWVAFAPFVALSVFLFVGGRLGILGAPLYGAPVGKLLALSVSTCLTGVPGLLLLVATHIAIRRAERRDVPRGFELVLRPEQPGENAGS